MGVLCPPRRGIFSEALYKNNFRTPTRDAEERPRKMQPNDNNRDTMASQIHALSIVIQNQRSRELTATNRIWALEDSLVRERLATQRQHEANQRQRNYINDLTARLDNNNVDFPNDPHCNEENLARERNQQIHVDTVEVAIVEQDTWYDYEESLAYQRGVLNWLQREYGDHVEVNYTFYTDYLDARDGGRGLDYRVNRSSLSSLLLQYIIIERIVHDTWYLPENPEFSYECLINSLTALGAHKHPLFDKLLWRLVTSTIFVRC